MKNKRSAEKGKTLPEQSKAPAEKKNPVIRTAKRVLTVLQNKVIASLMMFGQGILFIVSPSGDMEPTVRISAGVILALCVFLIIYHLRRKDRNRLDIAIAVFNSLLACAAVYCMITPNTVEPFVKTVTGLVTVGTGLVNLIQTLKIEKKKDWKFVVSVLGAVAIISLGVVMIVAEESSVAVMQQSMGAILMLNALANIWYIVQLHRNTKKEKAASLEDSPKSGR